MEHTPHTKDSNFRPQINHKPVTKGHLVEHARNNKCYRLLRPFYHLNNIQTTYKLTSLI